jgi:hypothetical protein
LGIITDQVLRICQAAGLSHLQLPRSRRDAAEKPWHVGEYLKVSWPHPDTALMLWEGTAMYKDNTPMQAWARLYVCSSIVKAALLPPHQQQALRDSELVQPHMD